MSITPTITLKKSNEVAAFLEIIIQQIDLAVNVLDMEYFRAFILDQKNRVNKYEIIGIDDSGDYGQKLEIARADLKFAICLEKLILARKNQATLAIEKHQRAEAFKYV